MALKWRKAAWPDKTYHARHGNLTYRVDFNGSRWTVRGWIDGDFALYDDGPTMSSMKQVSADHATKHGD